MEFGAGLTQVLCIKLLHYCKNYRDEEKEPPSLHDNEHIH